MRLLIQVRLQKKDNDESVYRILSLKNKYDLSDTTKMNSIGIEEINNKINNLFY